MRTALSTIFVLIFSLSALCQTKSEPLMLPTPSLDFTVPGTLKYQYCIGEDGSLLKNGPLSFVGQTNQTIGNENYSTSYSLSANFKMGLLNGPVKGSGKEVKTTRIRHMNGSVSVTTVTTTYSISGSFTDGKPNGPFAASSTARSSVNGLLSSVKVAANYKDGVLVGAYNVQLPFKEISGSFTPDGILNGTWYYDEDELVFKNGVRISEIQARYNEATPPSITEVSKKYAAGEVSREHLESDGYLINEHNWEAFEDADSFILSECYGIRAIGGYSFAEKNVKTFYSIKQTVVFTETGFENCKQGYQKYLDTGEIAAMFKNDGFFSPFGVDKVLNLDQEGVYYIRWNTDLAGIDESIYLKNYKQYKGGVILSEKQSQELLSMKKASDEKKAREKAEAERIEAERRAKAKAEAERIEAERKAMAERAERIQKLESVAFNMVRDNQNVMVWVVITPSGETPFCLSSSQNALESFISEINVDGNTVDLQNNVILSEGRHIITFKTTGDTIAAGTFMGNPNIVTISFPSALKKICAKNFFDMPNLQSIYFNSLKAPSLDRKGGDIFASSTNGDSGRMVHERKYYYVPSGGKGYDKSDYSTLLKDIGYILAIQ